MRRTHAVLGTLLLVAAGLSVPAVSRAFQAAGTGGADQDVVIKREAIALVDPKTYKVPLRLSPIKSIDLTAPIDGFVRNISIKPAQKATKEAEALRLDDARAALELKRAKANLTAAKIEKKVAKSDADLIALADAHIEAAQAAVDLAQFDADRLIVRIPFNGEIHRVHVVDGQFVRAGDRLATLADTSRLQVEVPVERSKASAGGAVDLKVEEAPAKAKIEAVLPLDAQFEPLRELSESLASAVAVIDNAQGKFQAGQAVYTSLIPVTAVASVPTIAVTNQSDGNRKVQVLRDNVVRNVTVSVLAKVGTERVFVSGPFAGGDEVVVSTSRELADGTPVKALLVARSDGAGGAAGAQKSPAVPAAGAGKKPAASGF